MADPDQFYGANMPVEKVEPKKGKKGILPGIWSAKDGSGPAKWRTDNSEPLLPPPPSPNFF